MQYLAKSGKLHVSFLVQQGVQVAHVCLRGFGALQRALDAPCFTPCVHTAKLQKYTKALKKATTPHRTSKKRPFFVRTPEKRLRSRF
jgi:hypothetical protein